jgi:O-antigen/teichoic acid export membrane protein
MRAEGTAVWRWGARVAALGRLDARFLRRLVVAGLGNAMGRALGLLFALMLAALFVPADYGYIRWAMSVGMLAAIPAAAGPVALARALGAARDDPARQRGLARAGLAAILAVTVLCALGAALVLSAFGRPVGGVVAVLVGMTLYAACFNVYRGVESAWRMAALYAGGNTLQLALVLLLCGLLGLQVPDLAVIVYGGAWVLVLLALEWRAPLLRQRGPACAGGALGALWRVWGPLVAANVAYVAWAWGDVVLAEHILGPVAAGHYALARTLVTVFLLVPEAVAFLLLPRVAAEGRAAGRLTGTLLALTAAVSAGLLAAVLLAAPPLLDRLGDGRYAPATLALPGLAVGMTLYALYMVLEGHLVGLGHAGAHAAGIMVLALVTLGGGALLLPALGLVGGGLAFALGAAAGLATLTLLGRHALAAGGSTAPTLPAETRP